MGEREKGRMAPVNRYIYQQCSAFAAGSNPGSFFCILLGYRVVSLYFSGEGVPCIDCHVDGSTAGGFGTGKACMSAAVACEIETKCDHYALPAFCVALSS